MQKATLKQQLLRLKCDAVLAFSKLLILWGKLGRNYEHIAARCYSAEQLVGITSGK